MLSVAGLGDARRVVMHGDDAGRIQLQGAPGDLSWILASGPVAKTKSFSRRPIGFINARLK